MQREKQIEEMADDLIACHTEFYDNGEIYTDYQDMAENLIEKGYRKQSEWISVEERLPDNYRAVLVVCESTSISGGTSRAIGSYGGGFWSLADADGTHYLTKYMHVVVTHWMELPEAPKKGGGKE